MASLQEEISSAILTRIRARRKTPFVQPRERLAVCSPKLRNATFSDFSQIARLKERAGLTSDSIANWERLWKHNPAIVCGNIPRPIGWVLEADGEIVGYLGNIPLRCYFRGRWLSAVAAHAFVVEPPYRAMALSLAGAFYGQEDVDLYLSTSAIESTGKLARLFKSAQVPQPDYDSVFFWVLRAYPFSRATLRKFHLPPVLSSIACLGLSLVFGTSAFLRGPSRKKFGKQMAVEAITLDAIDQGFLELWRHKTRDNSRLFADRHPDTLKWHFQIPGDRGSVVVLACRQGELLEGYAILRTDTNAQTGLRKSVIADMLVENDNCEIVRLLLSACYERAIKEGSDVLEAQGFPSQMREVFSESRPHSRRYPACPYYFKAADPELQKELDDATAWYACPYDGDTTLIRPSYPLESAVRTKVAAKTALDTPREPQRASIIE